MHQHGSAYPTPRTKAELIRHLSTSHGEVERRYDPHRWSVPALKEEHDGLHKQDRQDASAETQSTPTPDGPSGTDADYSTDLVAVHAIQNALSVLDDDAVALETKAPIYVRVRALRLYLDRVLRKVSPTIRDTMVQLQEEADPDGAGRRRFRVGGLRLVWKPIEPRYVVNEGPAQSDPTIQQALAQLYTDTATRPYVRRVPQHYEVDTRALGMALAAGDPQARLLYEEMKDRKWRIEEGRSPTVEVDT